jgi:7,8-dihydroneopterin aldolase/epimerase/oxygenase
MITVEVAGLELRGRHGVEEDERQREQTFVYDVWLDVRDEAASDRLEATADYRGVVACVREVSAARSYHLLEALAAAVADAILERLPAERVRVRVRKPEVELGAPVEFTAATAQRSRQ